MTPPEPQQTGRGSGRLRPDMRLIAQILLIVLVAAALIAVVSFVYINRYVILQSVSTALGIGLVLAIVIIALRLSRPFRWW